MLMSFSPSLSSELVTDLQLICRHSKRRTEFEAAGSKFELGSCMDNKCLV